MRSSDRAIAEPRIIGRPAPPVRIKIQTQSPRHSYAQFHICAAKREAFAGQYEQIREAALADKGLCSAVSKISWIAAVQGINLRSNLLYCRRRYLWQMKLTIARRPHK